MKVSVYGVGYVGLVAAVCFANLGIQVLCYDVDKTKIDSLRKGQCILYEPDLENLLVKAIEKQTIKFSIDIKEVVAFSDIHLMCVGTPPEKDGSANLMYLRRSIESIVTNVTKPFTIVIKSTVPAGTAYAMMKEIDKLLTNMDKLIPYSVVSCPEFLAQGSAVHNFMHPDRIIIGADNDKAFEIVKELYSPVVKTNPQTRVIRMTSASAELAKYASNLFLATKISYMNEISRIAELTGADISEVICGMVSDKRIGSSMSNPGCGFGGSCLPKDLKALIHQSSEYGYNPNLLKAVLEVNDKQKKYFTEKVFFLCDGDVKDKTIAIWGLAFKPNTDDLREAVSIDLIEELLKAGAVVKAYDPMAGANAQEKFKAYANFKLATTKEEALEGADLLVVASEWPEFFHIDMNEMKKLMNRPIIVDGRNIYDPKVMTKLGVFHFSVGRKLVPIQEVDIFNNIAAT